MDVTTWLRGLGLERYEAPFRENEIDADLLPTLTADDLKELGVTVVGHRRRLLNAISGLSRPGAQASFAQVEGSSAQGEAVRLGTARRHAERRQLTVLFSDLVGSTALSARLDPEDMREVIRMYQDAVAGEVTRFEGYIANYMGDGVLAYFGWPRAHEDDAERAVRAGLAVSQAVARIHASGGEALAVRVGIATGLVVVGDLIGQGSTQEEAVIGETPNLAARLQGIAAPGAVVIAPGTRRLLGGTFALEELGARPLKGFDEPIDAWRVRGESTAEGRFEAQRGARLTPLTGRKNELELLLSRWRQARDGHGQVVVLSGEPGIGKSRIVRSLLEAVADEPHVRLRYQCSPYHTASAFHPIIERLQRSAGMGQNDPPAVKLDKLEALCGRSTSDLEQVVPLVAALLSIPTEERYPTLELSPQLQKQRTLEALLNQVDALAARQPVLMVLEDAHWIDPSSQELLELRVTRAPRLAVFLVVTCRPEYPSPWRGRSNVTHLTLHRLKRSQATRLVTSLTGRALPPEVLEQILEKTDGVPLFLEELTKTVVESGHLRAERGRYVLEGSLPNLAIPTTLQDSLMARLDRLPAVREVAQVGAVIGREFSYEVLTAVAPVQGNALDKALDELTSAGLIFARGAPPHAIYSFKHALVQDAAYASLLKSRRQQLHAQVATILEERFATLAAQQPELVARHFTEAGLPSPAIRYWHLAAERATVRAANAEAIRHLTRAIELVADLVDPSERRRQELAVLTTFGRVLTAAKGYGDPEVAKIYSRAHELCGGIEDNADVFPILLGLTIHNAVQADLDTAEHLAQRLIELASHINDPVFLVEANYALGIVHSWRGNFLPAWEHLGRAIDHYDTAQHRAHLALYGQDGGPVCLCRGAMARWYLGYPDQALALMNRALEVTDRLGHPFSRAYVLVWATYLHMHRRDIAEAERCGQLAATLAEEHGFPYWHTQGSIQLGWVLAQRGELRSAITRMKQGLDEIQLVGTKVVQPLALSLLGEAYGKIGQTSRGLALVDEALQLGDRTGGRWFEAEGHRIKGELIADRAGPAASEAAFARAIDVARAQDAKSWELRAAASRALLWRDQGKRAEAYDLLAPIYSWFTEGFDAADLIEARKLLDELA